jgi:hypothetical protein
MRPSVQSARTALPRRDRDTRVSLALDDLIDHYDLNDRAECKNSSVVCRHITVILQLHQDNAAQPQYTFIVY